MRPPNRRGLFAVLGAGLALRLVLAYAVFPGQGYAGDVNDFGSWAVTLARHGPGAFYASAPGANYPPAYLYVLWALGAAAHPLAAATGASRGGALLAVLKLPAILADVGVAALLAQLATDWRGRRAGLGAAALYLFVPVVWYDSAIWGQVDAVETLVMIAALAALLEGWSEAALALAVLAVLVKPQGVVGLVVVAPILVRRHLLAVGSGPVVPPGRLLSRSRVLRRVAAAQGPMRLVTSSVTAAVLGLGVLAPFDINVFAHGRVRRMPVLGDVAGLAGLLRSVSAQFDVVTANAYNVWALVGPHRLVDSIGTGTSTWTPDSLRIVGGVSALDVGSGLLAITSLAVIGGLLVRDSRLGVLLGFTVIAFAFYAEPTRVHERYLFPAFASGAVLASVGLAGAVGYLLVGLVNTVNVHAVLAAPLALQVRVGSTARGLGRLIPLPSGGRLAFDGARSVHLPLAGLARSAGVATTMVILQSVVMVALLAWWCHPRLGAPQTRDRDAPPR